MNVLTPAMASMIDSLTPEQEDRLLGGKLYGRCDDDRPKPGCPQCMVEVALFGDRRMGHREMGAIGNLICRDGVWRGAYANFETQCVLYGAGVVASAIRDRILRNQVQRTLGRGAPVVEPHHTLERTTA